MDEKCFQNANQLTLEIQMSVDMAAENRPPTFYNILTTASNLTQIHCLVFFSEEYSI